MKHLLSDVLILVLGAVICGMTELADMMVYFNKKIEFYNERFGISKYPSKPTLSRILNMVDGYAVGKVMEQMIKSNFWPIAVFKVYWNFIQTAKHR